MIIDKELKENRIGNTFRNTFVGLFLLIVVTFVPFVIRTLMMRFLGDNLLGLNGVLQSTVWMLNMAELGLSSVVVFFIYEPAAKGDYAHVNAYLKEIRKLYAYVAAVIFVIGTAVAWFVPNIAGNFYVDGVNTRLVYFLYLFAVVIQYVLWPEAGIVLNAYQRIDLQHIASLVSNLLMYLSQIIVICLFRSFVLYVIVVCLQAVLRAVLLHLFANSKFKGLVPRGRLELFERQAIKRKMLSMVGHQLDEKLINNVDNIFISVLLGLEMVTVFGNYYYVVTAISMIVGVIYNSALASIGNAIVVETVESNRVRFSCLLFLSGLTSGFSTICMISLYQSFMRLWMPGLVLPTDVMVLFCIYSYLIQFRKGVQTFKNAAGMWDGDKLKPYISMIADIIFNALLIPVYGLSGAIISSIICIGIIEFPWETYVVLKQYFKTGVFEFVAKLLKYNLINIALIALTYCLMKRIVIYSDAIELLIKLAVSVCVGICAYIIIYWRDPEFVVWKQTIRQVCKGNV